MKHCNCNNINLHTPTYNPCKHKKAEIEDYYPLSKVEELKTFLENLEKCLAADLKDSANVSIVNTILSKLENIEILLGHDDASILMEASSWLTSYCNGSDSYSISIILNFIDRLKTIPDSSKYYNAAQKLLEVFNSLSEKVTFDNEDIDVITNILTVYKEYCTEEQQEKIDYLIEQLTQIQNNEISWSDIDLDALYNILNKAETESDVYNVYKEWFNDTFEEQYAFWKLQCTNMSAMINSFSVATTQYYDDGEDLSSEETIKELSDDAWADNYNQTKSENPRYVWKRDTYKLTQLNTDGNADEFTAYQYTWFVILPEGVVEESVTVEYNVSSAEIESANTIVPVQPTEGWVSVYPTSFSKDDKYLWTKETKTYSYPENYSGELVESNPLYSWVLIGYTNANIPMDAQDGNTYFSDSTLYCSKQVDGTSLFTNFSNFNTQDKIINAEANGVVVFNEKVPPVVKTNVLFWKKITRTHYDVTIVDGFKIVKTDTEVFYEPTYYPGDETLTTEYKYIYENVADLNNPPLSSDSRWGDWNNASALQYKYYWRKESRTYTDNTTDNVRTLEDIITLHKQGEQGLSGKDGVDGTDGETVIVHDGYKEIRNTTYTVWNNNNSAVPSDNDLNELTDSVWSNSSSTVESQWVQGSWFITRIISEFWEYDTTTKAYVLKSDNTHTVRYEKTYYPFDGNTPKQLYSWVKYAKDSNGTDIADYPKDGTYTYIGLAENKETNIPSNNPSDYTWVLFNDSVLTEIDGEYYWFGYIATLPESAMPSDIHDSYQAGDLYWGIYKCADSLESKPTNPSVYSWTPIGQGSQSSTSSTIEDKETYSIETKYLLATDDTDYGVLAYVDNYNLNSFPIKGIDYEDSDNVKWVWKLTKYSIDSTSTYSFDRFLPGVSDSLVSEIPSQHDWYQFYLWLTEKGESELALRVYDYYGGVLYLDDFTDDEINQMISLLTNSPDYTTNQWAINIVSELQSQQSINAIITQTQQQVNETMSNVEALLELDKSLLQSLVTQTAFNNFVNQMLNKINSLPTIKCNCNCHSHIEEFENRLNSLESQISTLAKTLKASNPEPQIIDKMPFGVIMPYVGSLNFTDFQTNCGAQYFPLNWIPIQDMNSWLALYTVNNSPKINFTVNNGWARIYKVTLRNGTIVNLPTIDDFTFLAQNSAGYNPTNFEINFIKENGVQIVNKKEVPLPSHGHALALNLSISNDGAHYHDLVLPTDHARSLSDEYYISNVEVNGVSFNVTNSTKLQNSTGYSNVEPRTLYGINNFKLKDTLIAVDESVPARTYTYRWIPATSVVKVSSEKSYPIGVLDGGSKHTHTINDNGSAASVTGVNNATIKTIPKAFETNFIIRLDVEYSES